LRWLWVSCFHDRRRLHQFGSGRDIDLVGGIVFVSDQPMTLQEFHPGDIPAELDRRPFIGTYTNLHTFRDVCEEQFQRRYILKDQKFVETPEMKWGNDVHAAFEKRIGKGQVLPGDMRQWEHFAQPFDKFTVLVEQKWGITIQGEKTGFFDNDVYFRGKADTAIIENEKAMINDFKTGNSKYEDPFELATNAVLLKAQFPKVKKVVGRYLWLKENRAGRMYDLSDFNGTWDEIGRLMRLIAEKRKSGDWVKRKSGLCGYCSVSDCEHHYVAKP
jgi:hypothetical protein